MIDTLHIAVPIDFDTFDLARQEQTVRDLVGDAAIQKIRKRLDGDHE